MKSICLISGSSPEFLGGISLYQRNLIKYTKEKKLDLNFTWIYPGEKNKNYRLGGIHCIEIKSLKYPFLKEFDFARKVKKIILKKYFDIINTHANWGYCLKGYKKKENQKIIHTYHGVTYYFYKKHLERFNIFLKALISPSLILSYILEKPPIKKSDKIICVSNRVKREINELYKRKKDVIMIRTGVDLKKFKKIDKKIARKKVNIPQNDLVGLYVGRGGWFRKGLDRTIKISEEFYKINKNYKLIIIGPDKHKVKDLIEKPFITYFEALRGKRLAHYYHSSDIFFCFSRYEGGAPIMTLSEAMAANSFVVCSEDSQQEIIKNKENGLIINKFGKKEAENILKLLKDKKEISKIKKSAKEKIKGLSLEKWGAKIIGQLMN